MFKDADRLSTLFKAYVDHKISDEDMEELENWLSRSPDNRAFFNTIIRKDHFEQELAIFHSFDPSAAFERFVQHEEAVRRPVMSVAVYRRPWFRFTAAAAALVAGIVLWVWIPAFNGSSKTAGVIASELSTVSTFKGKTEDLVLPDGSHVWLNTASTIKYPRNFSNEQRVVEIIGEAYFEVAKDSRRPFLVRAGSTSIEVLGTSFNITAYPEEDSVTATLVEGKVKVLQGKATAVLLPNEQARMSSANTASQIPVRSVNVEDVMAWKRNDFNFDRTNLEVVLRQIGRWYDVELIYMGARPAGQFSGMISRGKSLTQVLSFLEQSGLKVTRKGEKVFIQ